VDVLSDTQQALLAAGLDEGPVRAVMRAQRARWGGGDAYVRRVDPQERESAIRETVAQGLTPRHAAAVVGCSEDTIRRVLGRG
jgi:DNA invertase Pin-like site-specific DNA recombinase